MNSQTIVNRANSEHFGHEAAHADHHSNHQKTTPVKEETKSKKGSKAAAQNKAAAANTTAQAHVDPQETTFRLDAPSANEVLLAGNFTEWDKNAVKMIKGGGGSWHAKVSLPPGRHLYRFVVDGAWQDDPSRSERVQNPYGSSDTVLVIS